MTARGAGRGSRLRRISAPPPGPTMTARQENRSLRSLSRPDGRSRPHEFASLIRCGSGGVPRWGPRIRAAQWGGREIDARPVRAGCWGVAGGLSLGRGSRPAERRVFRAWSVPSAPRPAAPGGVGGSFGAFPGGPAGRWRFCCQPAVVRAGVRPLSCRGCVRVSGCSRPVGLCVQPVI